MSPSWCGLYLHIPFCGVKCRYCDFAVFPGRLAERERYLTALAREVAWRAEEAPGARLTSLYVGGGTPSVLTPEEWERLVGDVRRVFAFSNNPEISVEANPEDMTLPLAQALARLGVNRISMGLQTHDPSLLKTLGRRHDWDSGVRAMGIIRRAGIDNINVDLMYGLPGQTMAGWIECLHRARALDPAHLSCYALSVEERTWFHRAGVTADDDLQAEMYEAASDILTHAGFVHYEISNFARPGRACRHNRRTWRNRHSLGAGVSAAWYDGCVRRTNTDSWADWLDAVEAGRRPPCSTVTLSAEERAGETLLLGLRLKEGVRPTDIQRALYGGALEAGVSDGLLERRGARHRPTRRGWRLSNRLFVRFLGPEDGHF